MNWIGHETKTTDDIDKPADWRCCLTVAIVIFICALLIGVAWN